MRRSKTKKRFVNYDADLPYELKISQIVDAVDSFYEYWYQTNEWHINQGYGRFHEQFRANNAIGGFVSHRITTRIAQESPEFILNRLDDGYPDLLYDGAEYEWSDDYAVKNDGGPGLEIKASIGNSFYAHHNVEGWLLGIHYQINARSKSATSDAPAPNDITPIEITQVLCASMDHDDWEYRDAEGSNRTNTSELKAKGGMYELRSNPIIETVDGITGQGEKLEKYKQNHSKFDPQYRN